MEADVGTVEKWGQVSFSLRFFAKVVPQGYRGLGKKKRFFIFNFLDKEVRERQENHMFFSHTIHLTLVLKTILSLS